jgi:hypothetical protein
VQPTSRVPRHLLVAVAIFVVATSSPARAAAEPAASAAPGMEIHQGSTVCTLGFVEVSLRIAVSTGQCNGGPVATDAMGRTLGSVVQQRRAGDAPVAGGTPTDLDYEIIGLDLGVDATDTLSTGRQLESKPGAAAEVSGTLCHFGSSSGESCGQVSSVSGGRFVLTGMTADERDIGGPVYSITDANHGAIVGLLESVSDSSATAESWQAAMQQLFLDTRSSGHPPIQLAARRT